LDGVTGLEISLLSLNFIDNFLVLLLCKLSEFLYTGPEVPGSIPCATRFSELVAGLERGPLSIVRITGELLQKLEKKCSGSDLEI
jgi:hypothetical protein